MLNTISKIYFYHAFLIALVFVTDINDFVNVSTRVLSCVTDELRVLCVDRWLGPKQPLLPPRVGSQNQFSDSVLCTNS